MNDPNAELRDKISRLNSWSEVVFKRVTALCHGKISYNKWVKLVSEYYIDMMNGDGSETTKRDATHILLLRTSKKSEIDYCTLNRIFREVEALPYKPLNIKLDKKIRARYQHLCSRAIEALSLRYHMILKSGGHFLSMDTTIYDHLALSSGLPVLECYASPYNHCLPDYCSLFPADQKFGAHPPFDKYIDTINFPCRLIANPPYTVNSIKVFVDKLLKYMGRQRGEFIALLPHLHSSEAMERLLHSPNTASVALQGGTYLLHNFLTGIDITAPMLLYIVVNVGGCYTKSAELAADLAYKMRVRAMRLLEGGSGAEAEPGDGKSGAVTVGGSKPRGKSA